MTFPGGCPQPRVQNGPAATWTRSAGAGCGHPAPGSPALGEPGTPGWDGGRLNLRVPPLQGQARAQAGGRAIKPGALGEAGSRDRWARWMGSRNNKNYESRLDRRINIHREGEVTHKTYTLKNVVSTNFKKSHNMR